MDGAKAGADGSFSHATSTAFYRKTPPKSALSEVEWAKLGRGTLGSKLGAGILGWASPSVIQLSLGLVFPQDFLNIDPTLLLSSAYSDSVL